MRRTTLAGLTALALTATACGGGGEDRLGTGDDYTVLGALAELPGPTTPGLMIQTGDLTAATEAAGLQRPDAPEAHAMTEWIGPLIGAPVAEGSDPSPIFVPVAEVFNVQQLIRHEEYETALGWSLVDVDSFAEMSLPPDRLAVIAGDFSEDTVLADLPEVAEGVVTYGEGEDFSVDPGAGSAINTLGTPVRLAHQDGRIAASTSTPRVEEWLSGPEETLADDTALAGVASALDERDALSALLLSGGDFAGSAILGQLGASEAQQEQLKSHLEALPSTAFGTVGIGWGVADGAADITVAYHLGTENAAEQAVPEFESLYRDGVTLTSGQEVSKAVELVSVEADGEVLVVQVRPTETSHVRWLVDQLQRRDVPFAHN